MRIQLIFILLSLSLTVLAVDDRSLKDLFAKYDAIMDQKKIELIEEVFSKKFIQDSGGKEELSAKIRELAAPEGLAASKSTMSWRKGLKGNMYFAKIKASASGKRSRTTNSETEFIIVVEDGKPKIDGTLSDGN